MSAKHIVVIGDALLDVDLEGKVERLCPDAPVPVIDQPVERPRPGGAALAAALLAREGCDVTLITAIGEDAAGQRLHGLLLECGIDVVDLGLEGSTPEKIRVRASGQSVARIDRGGESASVGPWTPEAQTKLSDADAVLVSDYGRGMAAAHDVRAAVKQAIKRTHVVWDPHPRGPEPVAGIQLATPNRSEALRSAGMKDEANLAVISACAAKLVSSWQAQGICVTLGDEGALYQEAGPGSPLVVPALSFEAPDACGAGDRFAGAATLALASGMQPYEAVGEAVSAASAFVASGGAAGWTVPTAPTAPAPHSSSALDVIARTRAGGGTVVATGGCFDLLHAGHVRVLEAAKALGDCLVVCVNSDASVGRLKGPQRPIVHEEDRVAVLRALSMVDAVVVFDEDTPEQILQQLRPDVWAKGGDYSGRALLEAETLSEWGGACVTLPFLEDRSTTALVKEVLRRRND